MMSDDEFKALAASTLPKLERALASAQGPRDALITNCRELRDIADEIGRDPVKAFKRDPDEFLAVVRRLAGCVAGLGVLFHLEYLRDAALMEVGEP